MTAVPAFAFEREKAEGSGKELYWPSMPVTFALNSDCAGPDVPKSACIEAVKASFTVWEAPECTSLRFTYEGETSETTVGYDQTNSGSNFNLVVWLFEKWPYEKNGMALTTTTYQTATGIIVDADMELNGVDFKYAVLDAANPLLSDIANTVTHEAGHFVGLDHASDPGATMYPTAPYGEVDKRDLAEDDIAGICAVYPAPTEGDGDDAGRDCSCSSVSAGDPPPAWIAVLALAIGFIIAKSRWGRQPAGSSPGRRRQRQAAALQDS
jgi:MYXO-CTERM domain-containing protein